MTCPSWAQSDPPSLFDFTPDPDSPNLFDYVDPADSRFSIRTSREEGSYRVGPGDVLDIVILNVPEFSGRQQVLSDGTIRLPLIDDVNVQGMTLNEISQELSSRFVGILRRPTVTISLTTPAQPLAITVTGEVNRPGAYTFSLQGSEPPTVFSSIQTANGITPRADIRNIEVIRHQGREDEQTFRVDFWAILQGGSAELTPILLDGDVIQVPTAAASLTSITETTTIAQSNLAPDQIAINVVGEVNSPGQRSLNPVASLNEALLSAGGFNNRSNQTSVELLRINPDGTISQQQILVDFSADVGTESNPSLLDTDVIVVSPSRIAQTGDSLRLVLQPLEPVARILQIIRNIQRITEDSD